MPMSRYGEWPHRSVKSSKVVKLPNPRNSVHNAQRSASQNPERKKSLEAQKLAEWAGSRSSCTEVSDRQFGHSSISYVGDSLFFEYPEVRPLC